MMRQVPRNRKRTFRPGERGLSLLELAMTMPIALTVLTGILTFGVYLNKNLELQNATSLSAQFLANNRGVTSDPCKTVYQAFNTVAQGINMSNVTFTYSLNGVGFSGTTCTSGAVDLVQGKNATVTASYPCALAIYGKNLVPNCVIYASITEIVQ